MFMLTRFSLIVINNVVVLGNLVLGYISRRPRNGSKEAPECLRTRLTRIFKMMSSKSLDSFIFGWIPKPNS